MDCRQINPKAVSATHAPNFEKIGYVGQHAGYGQLGPIFEDNMSQPDIENSQFG